MSGGSSGGNAVQTTSGPSADVLKSYNSLTGAATSLAGQPLRQYDAPMVAGFTPDQQRGFSTIENASGIGTPYINSAAGYFGAATTPLWPTLPQYTTGNVNQYLSPYTQDVTDALTDLYNHQNAQQASQITGNAAMHGAFGGDREAAVQAMTAGEQQRAQAPTLAQVEQQGFQGAQTEFNTEKQQQLAAEQANAWLNSQAGFGVAGLGTEAQNQALTGANALLGAGGMQQKLAQEQINIPYQKFLQQQAYPYQQLGFLSPIVEGTGSLSGGTGRTTYPGPSTLSQVGGLGLAGLGLYGLGSQQGWWGGSGSSFGNVASDGIANPIGDAGMTGLDSLGFPIGAKSGGRIGFAEGGGAFGMPEVPGVGAGIPVIDLSYIPQAAPGGIPSPGLSPFQPVTTSTSSGGGGGGSSAAGDIGTAVGAANLAMKVLPFFLASGGRAGFAEGGSSSGGIGAYDLPAIPKINLDYISHPGPAVKGAGPPKAPTMPQGQDKGLMGDMSGLMAGAKELKGLGVFDGSSGGEHAAAGGGIGHYAMGGASIPLSAAIQSGGAPPSQTQSMQQLLELPMDRLQQMAVQFPPTSAQGQMVQRALQQKRMTPGAGTAPVAGGFGAPAQGAGFGAGSAPQQATGYAEGGATPGYVTEDELDPYPVIDHSGDTVKVRYPSEGKVLDLGIPSLKRGQFAAGGSAGAEFPHASIQHGRWDVTPGGGPTSPGSGISNQSVPLLGTADGESVPGTASPFFSTLKGGNGLAVPQLSNALFAPPTGLDAGGGMGSWFNPLAQYEPPGTSTTASGAKSYPSTIAYLPSMAGVISAFGGTVPDWAGGTMGGGSSGMASPITATALPPVLGETFQSPTSGDKRGGRIGYDEGGEVWDTGSDLEPMKDGRVNFPDIGFGPPPGNYVATSNKGPTLKMPGPGTAEALRDAGSAALDYLAKGQKIDPTTQEKHTYEAPFTPRGSVPEKQEYQPPFTPKDAGGIGADNAGLGSAPPTPNRGGGIGEPAAPEAMTTPDRGPPRQLTPHGEMVPPGTKTNSRGEAISDTLKTMSPEERENTRRAEAAIARGDTSPMVRRVPTGPSAEPAPIPQGKAPPAMTGSGGANGVVLPSAAAADAIAAKGAPASAAATPQYGPVAAALVAEADRQGVPRDLVLKSAQVESGMGTNLGSRGNILQLGQPEWQQAGGGNMADLATQAKNGVAWLARSKQQAQQALGREPQDWETYIVHQQGVGGGPALLKADPNTSAVDALAPVYGGNRQTAMRAIVGNGGDLSMTAGQFLASVKSRFEGYGSKMNLGASLGQGGGQGGGAPTGGPDEMVQSGHGIDAPLQKASAIAETALAHTPAEHRGPMQEWMRSPYFLAFLAGAGMLASKSPFPGVALGEGMQFAAKGAETMAGQQNRQEIAEIRAQHLNDLTNVRTSAAADKAASNVANLQFRYDNMQRLQEAGNRSAQLAADKAAVASQLEVAKVQLATAEHDRKVAADAANAAAKAETARLTGERDKATDQYHQGLLNRPPSSLALYERKQRAWLEVHPNDQEGAARYAGGQHDMTSDQKSIAAQKLAEEDLKNDYSAAALSAPQRQARLHQLIQFHLNELGTRQATPAAGAPASPAAPAASAPAAAHAPAAPAQPEEVIQNGWRYRLQNGQYTPIGPVQ